MTWRFKVFILASVLGIYSCKPKENDKIKLQPEDTVGAFFVDNFLVEGSTTHYDSAVSGKLNVIRHLSGVIENEEFGKVTAAFYSQLDFPTEGYRIEDLNATLVSGELHGIRNYYFGEENYYFGTENQNINFLLYGLKEQLSPDYEFYAFDNVELGNYYGIINIRPDEENFIVDLPENLSNEIFQLGFNDLENETQFHSFFNGITLQPYQGNGVLGFNVNDLFIRLIYLENGLNDTVDFYLNDEVQHFNRITYNRTGTAFQELNENEENISSVNQDNKILIQAGSRTEGVINFTDFNDDYFGSEEVIYKAELEFSVRLPDDFMEYNTGKIEVQINIRDSSGALATIVNDEISTFNNKFEFDITKPMQEVLGGAYKLGDIEVYASQRGHSVTTYFVDNPEDNITLKIYFNE